MNDDLIQPTIIYEYPVEVSLWPSRILKDPAMTDRFEIFAAGMEIGNAFTELNDPDEQRKRFEDAVLHDARKATMKPTRWMKIISGPSCYGMPPTAGEGIGIDRVTMLMTNAKSIRDVILFPLFRPEGEIGIANCCGSIRQR
ncbi:MAG: hypothetical protein QM757_28955 [Paludibaculum sp.]